MMFRSQKIGLSKCEGGPVLARVQPLKKPSHFLVIVGRKGRRQKMRTRRLTDQFD